MAYYLAVDIGASSDVISLMAAGKWKNGSRNLSFENGMVKKDGELHMGI